MCAWKRTIRKIRIVGIFGSGDASCSRIEMVAILCGKRTIRKIRIVGIFGSGDASCSRIEMVAILC
ncbi:MAG: hypothetical protein IIW10_03085, partial [Spirochaetaceae bacterium]|nr:hypothetical protein [Spirochaetaceae bacterium]